MNGTLEALCLRLLDLARAQKAALEAGNLDEALALAGKRLDLAEDIQKIDIQENARNVSGQSADGCAGTRGGFPDTLRATVEKILAVDGEMMAPVRDEMSAICDNLNCLGKLKRYIGNPFVPPVMNGDGVIA